MNCGRMGKPYKSIGEAIKDIVAPKLKETGFVGTYPHFRRLRGAVTDLLTFQTNRYGGSFVVELAQWNAETYRDNHLGTETGRDDLTAHTLQPRYRERLKPWWRRLSSDYWFQYDSIWQKMLWSKAARLSFAAHRIVRLLPSIDRAFRGEVFLQFHEVNRRK